MNTHNHEQNANESPKHEERIVKEIHHHYDRESTNFGRIFLGFAIVTIGILLLGQNFDVLPYDIELNVAELWPFLIILAGLSMFSGRSFLGSLLGFLVTLFVLALFVFALFGGFRGLFYQGVFEGSVFYGVISALA